MKNDIARKHVSRLTFERLGRFTSKITQKLHTVFEHYFSFILRTRKLMTHMLGSILTY